MKTRFEVTYYCNGVCCAMIVDANNDEAVLNWFRDLRPQLTLIAISQTNLSVKPSQPFYSI